jgi:hypothetical protein
MVKIKIDLVVYPGETLDDVIAELIGMVGNGESLQHRVVREVGDAGHPEVELSGSAEAIAEFIHVYDEAEA